MKGQRKSFLAGKLSARYIKRVLGFFCSVCEQLCDYKNIMVLVVKLLVVLISSACASEKVYEGFKVYDIKAKSKNELMFLKNLEESEGDLRSLDFLSFHNNVDDVVRLLVKPDEQAYIESLFTGEKIDYKVTLDNIQE